MKKTIICGILMLLLISSSSLIAAEKPLDPKKQTPWNLYVDAREAYEMKKLLGNKVLLVDVRDPIEIMFTGFSDIVDINIPFKLSDPGSWNDEKPVFAMNVNKNFEKQIYTALVARGLDKKTPIILMCRSGGTRGAPGAMMLDGKGYESVYVVTDGFEGGTLKEGDKKGWRLKDGWKNSGLPWSYKLNKEKMYIRN